LIGEREKASNALLISGGSKNSKIKATAKSVRKRMVVFSAHYDKIFLVPEGSTI
jgi:hypothetical protein